MTTTISRNTMAAAATAALLFGCAIYLFARPDSVYGTGILVTLPFAGQLPSFLHTLAFGLACALAAQKRPLAALYCWGGLELFAELLQHPAVPLPMLLRHYQASSSFDPADVIAIFLATLVAMLCLSRSRQQ